MQRRSSRGLGAALATTLLFSALAARAASPPELVVTRGDGANDCPDSAALAEAVKRLMGREAFAVGAAPQASPPAELVTVAIARGGLYTATIHSTGGERELADPGPGCAGLSDALALTLAILLDPEGRPPSPPSREKEHRPAHEVNPTSDLHGPEPKRLHVATVEIAGALATGIVSGAAPAFAGEIDLRASRSFSIALGAFVAPPHTWAYDSGQIRLSMVGASLRPCAPEIGRADLVRLRFCVEILAGALTANPSGLPGAETEQTVFFLGAGPHLHLDGTIVGPLGFALRADALYARPQQFVVEAAPSRGIVGDEKALPTFDFIFGAGLRLSIF